MASEFAETPRGPWYPGRMQEPASPSINQLKPGDLVRIKAGARNNRGDKLPDALALVSTPLEGEDGST